MILASLQSAWMARLFSWSPLVVLGRYSYCIYLIHLVMRQAVERGLHKIGIPAGNGVVIYLLMLLFSTAGASVLYYSVESRFRNMGRHLVGAWTKKAISPTTGQEMVRTHANNVAAGSNTEVA